MELVSLACEDDIAVASEPIFLRDLLASALQNVFPMMQMITEGFETMGSKMQICYLKIEFAAQPNKRLQKLATKHSSLP